MCFQDCLIISTLFSVCFFFRNDTKYLYNDDLQKKVDGKAMRKNEGNLCIVYRFNSV